MKGSEWIRETQNRANCCASFFSAKENMVIQDFIVTEGDCNKHGEEKDANK